MARPVLIIDFDTDSVVTGGVFSAGTMEPLRCFRTSVEGDVKAALSALMQEIRSNGFGPFSQVIAGLALGWVNMRMMEMPFSDKKRLDEIIRFEAEDFFLEGIEDLVIETVPIAGGKAVIAAVAKETLRWYLGMLKELGIDPAWVGVSVFSKDRLLKKLYDGDEVAALLDNGSMVVIKGKTPCFFKDVKGVEDLRLALSSLHEDGIEIERFYSCASAVALPASLGKEAVIAQDYGDGFTGLLAFASHFRDGIKEAVNFRRGEFANTKDLESARKEIKVTAVLLIAVITLWGAYLYLRHLAFKNDMARLGGMMEAGYHELFQAEGKAADPLYQLQVKLKHLKDEKKVVRGGVNLLEVVREMSQAITGQGGVRLYNVRARPGMVTASGEAGSFEGVNGFRDALAARRQYFKDITLTDVKSRPGAGVKFSISISVKDDL